MDKDLVEQHKNMGDLRVTQSVRGASAVASDDLVKRLRKEARYKASGKAGRLPFSDSEREKWHAKIEVLVTEELEYEAATAIEGLQVRLEQTEKELREAFAWGLDLRHKKNCPQPASNFQKGQPCKCGRDALYAKLNALAFSVHKAVPSDSRCESPTAWVPTAERLPPKGIWVVCTGFCFDEGTGEFKNDRWQAVAYRNEFNQWKPELHGGTDGIDTLYDPSHWMPLPAPPSASAQQNGQEGVQEPTQRDGTNT